MSVQTSIYFLNSEDPEYQAARTGPCEKREAWEDENGPIEWAPGKRIECNEGQFYEETDEEYGGWIIDVRNLPPGTTHIKIERG